MPEATSFLPWHIPSRWMRSSSAHDTNQPIQSCRKKGRRLSRWIQRKCGSYVGEQAAMLWRRFLAACSVAGPVRTRTYIHQWTPSLSHSASIVYIRDIFVLYLPLNSELQIHHLWMEFLTHQLSSVSVMTYIYIYIYPLAGTAMVYHVWNRFRDRTTPWNNQVLLQFRTISLYMSLTSLASTASFRHL